MEHPGKNGGRGKLPATKYSKSRMSVRHQPTDNLEWLGPTDVMFLLNISWRTLQTWEKGKILMPTRIIRKSFYKRADIDAMMERFKVR
jgi:hypothetical protein